MKKLAKFLPILFLSAGVISCCETEQPDDEIKTVEPTKLKYTYRDVCENYYRNSNAIPNNGEPKLLVLPIYFNDSNEYIPEDKKETVRQDIEKAFFGTEEENGYETVTSYYNTLSSGKCTLKGTVSNWIDIDESYFNYSIDESVTTDLCRRVVEQYFSTSNDVRKTYDLDENGFLDGVVLIYGCPDHENIKLGRDYGNLWAYTNWDSRGKKNVEEPALCNFMWASYDFMYSKNKAFEKTGNYYGSGVTAACELDTHIFIHEIGHMFGLIDYYDYSYQYNPAGGFSMQDCNIGCHDPYSVMALGWADPYIPAESCSITINTFQSSRECIILSNSWNEIDSPFDEYLIVELYSPDGLNEYDHKHQYAPGRPTGPDEIGIRLWHVDARLLYGTMKDPNNFTCDPTIKTSKVMHMMSNTYNSSDARAYTTPLGSAYTKYNLLQLIRNEEIETYQPNNNFDKYSLFKNGSKFSMGTFGKQFVNKAKLNSGKTLGWMFNVEIKDNQATIQLTRTI